MSVISKEMLSDRIRTALTHEVRAFLDQISPEDSAYQLRIEDALNKANSESMQPVADAWRKVAKDLEANRPDSAAARRQAAAMALLFVTNEMRLPLQLKGATPEVMRPSIKVERESEGKRMKRSEMRELLVNLIKAFPSDGAFIQIGELAEKAGTEVAAARSGLLRLKREGKVESNGRNGKAGAWKRL